MCLAHLLQNLTKGLDEERPALLISVGSSVDRGGVEKKPGLLGFEGFQKLHFASSTFRTAAMRA